MKKETSLIFTGDIGFDKYMAGRWEDEELIAPEVLKFLRNTDHLIVNVEGPLSAGNKPADGTGMRNPEAAEDKGGGSDTSTKDGKSGAAGLAATLKHSMDPKVADFLKGRLGADIWNICNNHIMDDGPDGMASTLAVAREHGAVTLGAGMNIDEAKRPVILKEAGGIGMIGAGYQRACRKASEDIPGCLSWSDMDTIRQQIELIKSDCRWCIVVAHGGEEFTALPSPYTRDRYHEYLKMGADIVISHHPHVPMNYETVGNKVIFYSLGNFIFDTDYQRSQFNTELGLFIKIDFTEEAYGFKPYGIRIDRESERIISSELPLIFEDVNEEEYKRLIPLAAKMFIVNTKKQLKYLYPDKFRDASEQDYIDNFYEPLRSGRVPGEVLDMQIMYPLSLKEEDKEWEKSTLWKVKKYITDQII
ncbi:MAG: CapA family protein [Lachnospiraceae bacterium]|nr:CapA family protein [Lachnospiraceae bacterium]